MFRAIRVRDLISSVFTMSVKSSIVDALTLKLLQLPKKSSLFRVIHVSLDVV